MTQTLSIRAEPRSETGKGPARRLRQAGKVPGVVYGHGREPQSLTLARSDLEKVMVGVGGSTMIDLEIDGTTVQTLVREVQRHPTRLDITHIDFLEVHAGEVITVPVPIHLMGIPDGVRNQGGVLDQTLREIEIRVLPKDIPEHIEVDVLELRVGQSVHVSDIEVPNAVILEDANATICSVIAPRVEAEPEEAVEEEEEAAEPELIRKPKAEGEEAAPEE